MSPIVTLELFARAVRNARDRAYQAISNPREGTILSVISDWSRSLTEHARDSRTFRELFDRTLPVVEESLRRTPEQLDILKQSGVVDAGAQGFYHFVRGARDFLLTGKKPRIEAPKMLDLDSAHDVEDHGHDLVRPDLADGERDDPVVGGLGQGRQVEIALGFGVFVGDDTGQGIGGIKERQRNLGAVADNHGDGHGFAQGAPQTQNHRAHNA